MRRLLSLLFVLAPALAACSASGGASAPTTTLDVPASTTEPAPTTTTPPPLPAAEPGPPRVLITPTGVVTPILGGGPGAWVVGTPCGGRATVPDGQAVSGATVVLDPGHGGVETGATGPNGLVEKDLNLVVAELTAQALERQGATVVLTRTADYRITLEARAAIARAVRPPVVVSVHHNGGHDGPSDRPGTEMYYQHASPDSKRLAGLLYEEVLGVFAGRQGVTWHANVDAGAKYRLNSRGGDYYGILRHTEGVTTVLSEALFLSSSMSEAELLARPDVQQAEADAIARAVRRYLLTDDAGSGFVEPIPRETPGGPGGGGQGCVDPPLV